MNHADQFKDKGLLSRYTISKSDGTPVDPGAEYFVLRLDSGGKDVKHVEACRAAIIEYAIKVSGHLPILSQEILDKFAGTSSPAPRYAVSSYLSGTVTVECTNLRNMPHLYIHHSNDIRRDGLTEDGNQRMREYLAGSLCKYLNGEERRPSWLSKEVNGVREYTRTSPTFITGPLGGTISAVGPMILPPNDNGRLSWTEDNSITAQEARKALIDRIYPV